MTTHDNIDPRRVPHSVAVVARDQAILTALDEHFLVGSATKRAADLAAALESYRVSMYWPDPRNRRKPPEGSSPRSVALHEILRLGRGRAPTAGEVRAIAESRRRAAKEE